MFSNSSKWNFSKNCLISIIFDICRSESKPNLKQKKKERKRKRKSGLKNWRRVRSGTAGASNKQTNRQTDRKAAIFFFCWFWNGVEWLSCTYYCPLSSFHNTQNAVISLFVSHDNKHRERIACTLRAVFFFLPFAAKKWLLRSFFFSSCTSNKLCVRKMSVLRHRERRKTTR